MRNKRNEANTFPVAMFVQKLSAEIPKPRINALTFGDLCTLNRRPSVNSERKAAIENFKCYRLFFFTDRS